MNDEGMTSQPDSTPPGLPPEWTDWLDCLRMGRQLGLADAVIRAELGITQATLAQLQAHLAAVHAPATSQQPQEQPR